MGELQDEISNRIYTVTEEQLMFSTPELELAHPGAGTAPMRNQGSQCRVQERVAICASKSRQPRSKWEHTTACSQAFLCTDARQMLDVGNISLSLRETVRETYCASWSVW